MGKIDGKLRRYNCYDVDNELILINPLRNKMILTPPIGDSVISYVTNLRSNYTVVDNGDLVENELYKLVVRNDKKEIKYEEFQTISYKDNGSTEDKNYKYRFHYNKNGKLTRINEKLIGCEIYPNYTGIQKFKYDKESNLIERICNGSWNNNQDNNFIESFEYNIGIISNIRTLEECVISRKTHKHIYDDFDSDSIEEYVHSEKHCRVVNTIIDGKIWCTNEYDFNGNIKKIIHESGYEVKYDYNDQLIKSITVNDNGYFNQDSPSIKKWTFKFSNEINKYLTEENFYFNGNKKHQIIYQYKGEDLKGKKLIKKLQYRTHRSHFDDDKGKILEFSTKYKYKGDIPIEGITYSHVKHIKTIDSPLLGFHEGLKPIKKPFKLKKDTYLIKNN